MTITLCGSTRFKDTFFQVAEELTLAGHIVLMPLVFHHVDNTELSTKQKIQLDNLHKQKIDMSDAIYVVNQDGYIGESTFGEIDWAERNNKQIFFLETPVSEDTTTDEEEKE